MSLSTIDTEHLNDLILATSKLELDSHKVKQSIQRNSNNYGKLKMLARQLVFIKQEMQEIINDSLVSTELEKVSCKFKKIPGNTYYLYQKIEGDMFFSMLEPEIWKYSDNNIFLGRYKYDYDLSFQKISDSI